MCERKIIQNSQLEYKLSSTRMKTCLCLTDEHCRKLTVLPHKCISINNPLTKPNLTIASDVQIRSTTNKTILH